LQKFTRILYATACAGDDRPAMRQAVSLARNNGAHLQALVVRPQLPESLSQHGSGYDAYLKSRTAAALAEVAHELTCGDLQVTVEIVTSDEPAKLIIQHMLRGHFELLIKEADSTESGQGFEPVDMALLKYCPGAVWLSRPIAHHRENIRVAVAVDAEASAEPALQLTLRLLQLSRSLADQCDGELRIVSCWEYELEGFLRRNSWISLPAEDVSSSVLRAGDLHLAKLGDLVQKAGISGRQNVHHARGRAGELIPHFCTEHKIDILVMGTVARTGIPGFLFGNTAENIVRKLNCSLLALKPEGFVSPVEI